MKITLSKKLILLSLLLIGFSFASYHIVKTIKRKSILKSFFQEERWQQMRKDFSKIKKTKHTTIFFGDSMTENFEPYVPNSDSVSNMGIGGDFTEGLLKRIDNVTNSCPDKVFIMIGINDLVEKVPLSEIEDNYISLMETIQQSCPQTTIYIQSTLPTRGLNSLMSSSRDINKE